VPLTVTEGLKIYLFNLNHP